MNIDKISSRLFSLFFCSKKSSQKRPKIHIRKFLRLRFCTLFLFSYIFRLLFFLFFPFLSLSRIRKLNGLQLKNIISKKLKILFSLFSRSSHESFLASKKHTHTAGKYLRFSDTYQNLSLEQIYFLSHSTRKYCSPTNQNNQALNHILRRPYSKFLVDRPPCTPSSFFQKMKFAEARPMLPIGALTDSKLNAVITASQPTAVKTGILKCQRKTSL
jgi:hypothetical protein